MERLARESDEPGTLSARHAQRLAAGVRADGRPLGPVRPATRRLLESAFGVPIEELLGPPGTVEPADGRDELTARLAAARTADRETVAAFQQRLNYSRLLDRQLGGTQLAVELSLQIGQMQEIRHHSVDAPTRESLAAVIADACALVGWQWLDLHNPTKAWDHYAQGVSAAAESGSPALRSYVLAGQSVVLLDLDEPVTALQMTEHARDTAKGHVPQILAAWLSAAHGESCAANGLHKESLRCFDHAESLLSGAVPGEAPFLVFGRSHLARWRGSALARLRDRQAADVLMRALSDLPPKFIRAESALRIDLSEAFGQIGDRDAANSHAIRAELLAQSIGSVRHLRRIDRLRRASVSPSPAAESEDRP